MSLDEILTMERCWAHFEPPKKESDFVGEWVASIYEKKKRHHLFLGRVKQRFIIDEIDAPNCYATALEVDCLQEKLGITDSILREHNQPGTDVGVFAMQNIICTKIKAKFLGGNRWEFPQYEKIKVLFEKMKKLDRAFIYQNYNKKRNIAQWKIDCFYLPFIVKYVRNNYKRHAQGLFLIVAHLFLIVAHLYAQLLKISA